MIAMTDAVAAAEAGNQVNRNQQARQRARAWGWLRHRRKGATVLEYGLWTALAVGAISAVYVAYDQLSGQTDSSEVTAVAQNLGSEARRAAVLYRLSGGARIEGVKLDENLGDIVSAGVKAGDIAFYAGDGNKIFAQVVFSPAGSTGGGGAKISDFQNLCLLIRGALDSEVVAYRASATSTVSDAIKDVGANNPAGFGSGSECKSDDSSLDDTHHVSYIYELN